MTEAEVDVLQSIYKRDSRVTRGHLKTFLGAKQLFSREPGSAEAQEVVEVYSDFLSGKPLRGTFSELILPEDTFRTDEEIVAEKLSREKYLELYRKLGLVGVKLDDYEGATKWREKHNLTWPEFRAMSDEEVIALGRVAA